MEKCTVNYGLQAIDNILQIIYKVILNLRTMAMYIYSVNVIYNCLKNSKINAHAFAIL